MTSEIFQELENFTIDQQWIPDYKCKDCSDRGEIKYIKKFTVHVKL